MKFISSDKVLKSEEFINWRTGVTVKPQVMEIHPSNVCCNACSYCFYKDRNDAKIMTDEELGQALDYCKEIGVKAVTFSGGGEPFCNTNFLSNLAYATAALDLEAGVITNGVLLNKGMAEMVLSLPKVKWIRISFDAINSGMYKKIRGTNSFDIVKQNIKDLLEVKKDYGSKTTIGLQMVVCENNYKNIIDFIDFCNIEFPEVDYIQVRPLEVMIGSEPYNEKEKKKILKELDILKNLQKINVWTKVIISDKWDLIFGEREFGFTKCHCAPFIGVIDAYSNAYLCCHMVQKKDYLIGNIKEMTPEQFWVKRRKCYEHLGLTQGFNPAVCPVGCRGAGINRTLQGIMEKGEHDLFL